MDIKNNEHLSNRRLRTPSAAAVAGVVFAVLMLTSLTLLNLATPTVEADQAEWLSVDIGSVTLALSLVPFAGIAFLWFMGVLRDRMGHLEDQFFSTLFFGSGFLYLAMTFAAASVAGGMLSITALTPGIPPEPDIYYFARVVMHRINSVYAVRMSGMHMFVLGTIWLRTAIMPKVLVFATYVLAIVLLVGITFVRWVTLVFPTWVLVISVYILIATFVHRERHPDSNPLDGVG